MKIDFRKYATALREGAVRVLRRYPVETLLLFLATLAAIVVCEHDALDAWKEGIAPRIMLAFWYALVVFIVNCGAGCGPWRRIYAVSWLPLVPLCCWPGLADWLKSANTFVLMTVLTPLVLLMVRWAKENRRFVQDVVCYLRAAVLALFFANVTLGLFDSIVWSTAYIFGFEEAEWLLHFSVDTMILTECFVAPVLALMLFEHWEGSTSRGTRVLEILINYIVTPALVIYAALFYLYAFKILVTWTLPRGYVAWMVFLFTLLTFLTGMIRELLDKRTCSWFYERYSWVTLPAAVLFWIGVARRLGEYGLTEQRVYLILCGIVMTLSVLLFFSRRTGRYLWVCAAAFVICSVVNYVPALNPAHVAIVSQKSRFERMARSLELVDSTGRLRTTQVPLADTVRWKEYREAFGALHYVLAEDETYFKRVGVTGSELYSYKGRVLPSALYDRVYGCCDADIVEVDTVAGFAEVELPLNCRVERDPAYPVLYANIGQRWADEGDGLRWSADSLHLTLGGRQLLSVSGEEFVRRQMEAAGVTFDQLFHVDDEQAARLLDYRDDEVRILFGSIKIRRDSTSCECVGALPELVWTR